MSQGNQIAIIGLLKRESLEKENVTKNILTDIFDFCHDFDIKRRQTVGMAIG